MVIWIGGWVDRQTDRRTDGQKDRQTNIQTGQDGTGRNRTGQIDEAYDM